MCSSSTGICGCTSGWTGLRCDVMINSCSTNPCINNGQCVNGAGTYTCNCPLGFSGPTVIIKNL